MIITLFSLLLGYIFPHKSFIIFRIISKVGKKEELSVYSTAAGQSEKVSKTAMQTPNLHPLKLQSEEREGRWWKQSTQKTEGEQAFTPEAHGHAYPQHTLRPLGYDHCLRPQKLLTRNTQQTFGQNCSLQSPVRSQTLLLTSLLHLLLAYILLYILSFN